MASVNNIKAQITALNMALETGEVKNQYAIKGKIKKLKIALKKAIESEYKADNLYR